MQKTEIRRIMIPGQLRHLPHIHKALNSIPSTTKKRQKSSVVKSKDNQLFYTFICVILRNIPAEWGI
jgi:hypothetical protein